MTKTFEPALHPGGASALLADEEQFRLWLDGARRGDRIVYARVLASLPRETPMLRYARRAFDAGLVTFFQRREPQAPVGTGGFTYLAYRTGRPLGEAVQFMTPHRRLHGRASLLFGGDRA